MNELLPGMQSEARSRELSQFYTPPWLAERVARWACVEDGDRVIEPSAGKGALILGLDALPVCTSVMAYDIDPENLAALRQLGSRLTRAPIVFFGGDFLRMIPRCHPDTRADLALMNPPYEDGKDIAFIERALGWSRRVVGIFQSRIVHSQGRAEFWRHTDIQRMAILSERPHFGGEHSAKTDFVVLDLTRRQHARKQGEATPAQLEWWSRA